MVDKSNNISSQAVEKATGKSWDEWIDFLDEAGARNLTHKEIVHLINVNHYIESAWWRQSVTVGYEFARGSRILGETADAGFEIGVQKTIPREPREVWKLLFSPEVVNIWLGSVENIELKKGYRYQTADGTSGEIWSVKAGEKIRLTWKPSGGENSSTFQISLVPAGKKTSVRIHHEKLPNESEREQMKNHWRQVLKDLETLAPRK